MSPKQILLDTSELEAPAPLQLTLKNAADLKHGEFVKMVHRMKPCHLASFLGKMELWWADFESQNDKYIFYIAIKDDLQTIEFIKEKIKHEYDRTIT